MAPSGNGVDSGDGDAEGLAQGSDVTAAAERLFGIRLPMACRFVEHLTTTAVERGLVGPREVPRIWSRHVLNCAAVAELIPSGTGVADIGSGAGLPGVVLAIARPDISVSLIEPMARRTTWLAEVLADLELDTVRVVQARAEELRGDVLVEIATARAVAPLPRLWSLTVPLLRPGGTLLAIKGQRATQELDDAEAELLRLGAASWRVGRCGVGLLDPPTTVVVVTRGRGGDGRGAARST